MTLEHKNFEFKASFEVDEEGAIEGIAWPFGSPDRVGDMIEKGAFGSPQMPLPMLANHNPADPVGAWTSIEETDAGLIVKGKLLVGDVARARELKALVAAGAVGGLSIGFQAKQAVTRKGGGRTISELELVEISLVSVPCHPRARITSSKQTVKAHALATLINKASTAISKS